MPKFFVAQMSPNFPPKIFVLKYIEPKILAHKFLGTKVVAVYGIFAFIGTAHFYWYGVVRHWDGYFKVSYGTLLGRRIKINNMYHSYLFLRRRGQRCTVIKL